MSLLVPPPHGGRPVRTAGRSPVEARAAMILLHGRGATARDILTLADELDRPEIAYLAPQAARASWYPDRFLAPLEANEPGISSGLAVVGDLVRRLEEAGIPAERTILLGFSQGACMTVEYAARNPRRWGGVVALTGALLGPHTRRDYPGSLGGTPVFLGTSDPDPHVPVDRVRETAEVLEAMGGRVDLRIYPGMGHTVSWDELEAVRERVDEVMDGARDG